MTANATRPSWAKRILLSVVGLFVLTLIFIVAVRMVVREMYDGGGIESSSRIPLTSAPSWDLLTMWATAPMLQKSLDVTLAAPWESSTARTADLRTRPSSFDHSVAALQQIVPHIKATWKICAQRLAPAPVAGLPQLFPYPQKNLTQRSPI
jgi:hypothetical protein